MHLRASAAALATVLIASGAALVGGPTSAATDSTPGYSVKAITVDVRVGPKGDQPCRMDADLYVPDGTSRRHRAPAILTTNGFGGDKADGNQSAIGKGFVGQGYVVLSYSGLGFGKTTCKVQMDNPDWDGKAGKQMVDVLAGKRPYLQAGSTKKRYLRSISMEKRGDPRVGMIGGSYGGQIQYAVAMQDRRIDALVPIITWNDLAYSLAPNNVAKKQWIDLFFGAGIASGAESADVDPETMVGCPNFVDQACVGVAAMNTLGYPDADTVALAKAASVSTYIKRIKAPTLLVQGQKDTLFNLNESVATYDSLRKQGTTTKMIWQSWGHSGSSPVPGELDFGAKSLRDSYLGRRFLNWMDHFVRGRAGVSTGPRFEYFRDWVPYDTSKARAGKAIAKAYTSRRSISWKPTHTLYLTGNDALTPRRSAVEEGAAQYGNAGPAPTSYSETSGLEGGQVNNPPSDAPGTFAAFTSAPLKAPADLVGGPLLTVHLDAPVAAGTQSGGPSGQLVLFAKLYDVAPDGSKVLKNRLISPMRVSDVTKPLTVRLPGVVHRFATGHRLQVVIAASDFAYAGNTVAQPVTIRTGPSAPSTLALPLTSRLAF